MCVCVCVCWGGGVLAGWTVVSRAVGWVGGVVGCGGGVVESVTLPR